MEKQFIGIVIAMMVAACAGEDRETATRGHLVVAVSETAMPYIDRCAQAFTTSYQQAYIDIYKTTSREALVDLAEGRVRLTVLSRSLNADEKTLVNDEWEPVIERVVAHDAVVVVVHGDNPVEQITFDQLRKIFTGEVTNWQELGGENRAIIPLVRDRNSGTYQLFQDRVLGVQTYGATARACTSMTEILSIVEHYPGAIGLTGLALINEYPGYLKGIRVAETAEGPFVLPSQQAVFEERYPLRRPLVLCSFGNRMDLVAGFVTYMMSVKGQQLSIKKGLVPATMPVRVVEMK